MAICDGQHQADQVGRWRSGWRAGTTGGHGDLRRSRSTPRPFPRRRARPRRCSSQHRERRGALALGQRDRRQPHTRRGGVGCPRAARARRRPRRRAATITALGDDSRWPLLGVPLATTDGAAPRVVLCSPRRRLRASGRGWQRLRCSRRSRRCARRGRSGSSCGAVGTPRRTSSSIFVHRSFRTRLRRRFARYRPDARRSARLACARGLRRGRMALDTRDLRRSSSPPLRSARRGPARHLPPDRPRRRRRDRRGRPAPPPAAAAAVAAARRRPARVRARRRPVGPLRPRARASPTRRPPTCSTCPACRCSRRPRDARRRRSAAGGSADLIDAAIVTIGASVVSWVFLISPYFGDASLHAAERLVAIPTRSATCCCSR